MNQIATQTGTPFGIHRLEDLAYGCARRAQLDAQRAAEFEGTGGSTSAAVQQGLLMHAWLEAFYLKTFPVAEIPDRVTLAPEVLAALDPGDVAKMNTRLRLAWDTWQEIGLACGKILAVEQEGRIDEHDYLPTPYTFRPDLVVSFTKKQTANFCAQRGLTSGLEPGVYLVDHKTSGAANSTAQERDLMSLQGAAYMSAWNALHPKQRCQGLLYNWIILTATPSIGISLRYYDPVDEERLKQLKATLAARFGNPYSRIFEPWAKPLPCNPTRCWDWFRTCYYYGAGICARV